MASKGARKIIKGIGILLGAIIVLLLLTLVFANSPMGQRIIKNQVVKYLKAKTNTEISLGHLRVIYPRDFLLEDLFILDLNKDTLIYTQRLAADISIPKLLFQNTVEVKNLEINKLRANALRQDPDTVFNYSFLVRAFVAEEKEGSQDEASALKFALNNLKLTDVQVRFKDDVIGNEATAMIGLLQTAINEFDLEKQTYNIDSLFIGASGLFYKQYKPLTVLKQVVEEAIDSSMRKQAGNLPHLQFGDVRFQDLRLNYDDALSDTRANFEFGHLKLQKLIADLTNSRYQGEEGLITNSKMIISYRPTASNEAAVQSTADSVAEKTFSLAMRKLSLDSNQFKFDNLSKARQPGKVDFNHMNFRELGFDAEGIILNDSVVALQLEKLRLIDTSGFVLSNFSGKAHYGSRELTLDNIFIETPQTRIRNTTRMEYASQEALAKNPQHADVFLNLQQSQISLRDLAYFMDVPAEYRNERFSVNTTLTGKLGNLHIPNLQLSGFRNTLAHISGEITGLPDMDKARFDLNVHRIYTTRNDLLAFIPRESLPDAINLPGFIDMRGTLKGSLNNIQANLRTNSSFGGANINAVYDARRKGAEKYNADVALQNFHLGKLLKRDDVGRITGRIKADGTGIDMNTARVNFNADIRSAVYNDYTYTNVLAHGTMVNQVVDLTASSTDPNSAFAFNTVIDLRNPQPGLAGTFDLKQIDLQKLGFVDQELKISGLADLNFSSIDLKTLHGDALLTSLQIATNGRVINLDSLRLEARYLQGRNSLKALSKAFDLDMDGEYQLDNLAQAFINEVNEHFQIADSKPVPDQDVTIRLEVKNDDIVQSFVPEITRLAPASVFARLDTRADSMRVIAQVPDLEYGDYVGDSINVHIENKGDRLDYTAGLNRLISPSFNLHHTALYGNMADDVLDANLVTKDREDKNRYFVGGLIREDAGTYLFETDPDRMILNYDVWVVNPSSFMQFGRKGVVINDFSLSNGEQSLTVNSTTDIPNGPVEVKLNNFEVETLTKITGTDTTLASGTINGNLLVKDFMEGKSLKFEGDLTVQNLSYRTDSLGNLAIQVDNYSTNAYNIDASLTGRHEIVAKGQYITEPQSAMDVKVELNKLDLSQLESLSQGQILNGKGDITGELSLKGELMRPNVIGHLQFDSTSFILGMLNNRMIIHNERVNFSDRGIAFDRFTILDSLGQPAIIDGMIHTSNYRDFAFDLTAETENYLLMNSTEANNELFYGTAFVTSSARIGGDFNMPRIEFDAMIEDGTKFSFALPEDDPVVVEHEGIVRFIDMDAPPFNQRKALEADTLIRTQLQGMDISGNIEIDKDAELSIIVDRQNGDQLDAKGEAQLSFQMDQSGKISLTGRYELSEGSYNLSIGGIQRREFEIQQGSSIQWVGEPTEANVDITAIYRANASPMDLIADQIQQFDQSVRNTYKQRLPFLVYLEMDGQLLKPEISFRLDMPENERNAFNGVVYTKIRQINNNENDLNKQVFALLALGRFISDNPFQSLAGATPVSSIARQSVSRLLTQQLNNLASDLIRGIDIDFNLQSIDDYSTGQLQSRTDLEVGLSKSLLNDRLRVTVGSNFAVEGPRPQNRKSSEIAGNVSVEYLLSRDGRYRLRAYRRNQTDGIIEGEVIETGLTFAIVVDYDRFSEFFDSFKPLPREERRRLRAERRAEND